ncbi:MAG: NERD domain-containing protein [Lachnospiraceae bacterium]|nr:NERD domain-containing protein [Lachnospiraceae bacterium]
MIFNAILLIGIAVFLFRYVASASEYYQSSYYIVTHNSLFGMGFDAGKSGEYMIYKALKGYENVGAKFLFNLYVPKGDGTTSEIDVLMIHPRGIFVFESKNYSGWIFGNEKQKYWTQTLPQRRGYGARKEKFFNPIKQNYGHIKTLEKYLHERIPYYSIVVFSERCEFKSLTVSSSNVIVTKREYLENVMRKMIFQLPDAISEQKVQMIYNSLYPLTQVEENVKNQHIMDIRNR